MRTARRIFNRDATHTRVVVTLYTWGGDGVSARVEGFDSRFGHVVSCNTDKKFGPAAGSWSLTLKKPESMGSMSWLSLWRDPEDTYVFIQWVVDGQPIDGMLGMIDAAAETTLFDKAGGQEGYTVSGRDVGKALEQTQCFTNVYDTTAAHSMLAIQQRFTPRSDAEPPGHFVNAIAEAWLGNYDAGVQPWMLPPGMSHRSLWALLLDRVGCKDPEVDGLGFDAQLMHPDGARPLWSFLQEYSNSLMNELFVDLAPTDDLPSDALTGLRPALTLRRRPFPTRHDRSAWEQLPLHHIEAADVVQRAVTKGGAAHRYNYWMFQTIGQDGIEAQALLHDQGATAGRPGSIPIWNTRSIQKHGLRLWQQAAGLYLPLNLDEDATERLGQPGDGASWIRLAASWLSDLHDWYAPAPMELSGTLKLSRLYPEVRIGHRVREKGVTYYVEGVSNSWSMGARGETVVTVTRGEPDGVHLLDVVYEELEQGVIERDMIFMPREALQSFDEALGYFRDGAEMEEVSLNMRARVDAGIMRSDPTVEEGEGFTTTSDRQRPTAGEGGEVTPESERQLGHMPADSPRDARTRRAFRGEQEPTPGQGRDFDQTELESGNPIDVGPDGDADPLAGLDEDDLGAP